MGFVCFSQFKYFIRVFIVVFVFRYFNDHILVFTQRDHTMADKKVVANNHFDWHNYNESESKYLMQSRLVTSSYGSPSLQNVLQSMQNCDAYKTIFPQVFNLMTTLLAIPMSTARVG